MKKLVVLCLLFPFMAFSQKETGMHFEHLNNWKEVVAKAKAENKYIFLDAYTTWCGPCKYMSANIFPKPEVGEFFNQKYINVKIQLDTTSSDNEYIKKWYQDGHDLANLYEVRAYPTYLFFNPNGEIVHRAVGSSDAPGFLAKGKDAITEEKQYYTQFRKFEKGERNPVFLRNLAGLSNDAYDLKNADKITEVYLATQTNLFTKENLEFLSKYMSKSTHKGFDLFLKSPKKVNAILGENKAEQKLMDIISMEEVYPVIFKRYAAGTSPDFDALLKKLDGKYPTLSKELIAKSKVVYYQEKGDWTQFQPAVVAYMSQYGAKVNDNELNSFAWTVFENCSDMKCVAEALNWSKRSFQNKPNPMFMDTYANILHKLGRTAEAIQWEEKAVQLTGEGEDKKGYIATIEKMKKGEKTWVEKN